MHKHMQACLQDVYTCMYVCVHMLLVMRDTPTPMQVCKFMHIQHTYNFTHQWVTKT